MHDLFEVLRVQGVEDPVEVITRWALALMERVGEVLDELGVLLQLWPEFTDGELVVLGHLDRGDGVLLEEVLLAGQDLLQEVLVDVALRREEVLD